MHYYICRLQSKNSQKHKYFICSEEEAGALKNRNDITKLECNSLDEALHLLHDIATDDEILRVRPRRAARRAEAREGIIYADT